MMSMPVTRSCMNGCTPCRFRMLRMRDEEDGTRTGRPEVTAAAEEIHPADHAGGHGRQRERFPL